jgi:hypothetical protein
MRIQTINSFIGYGILIFVTGFVTGMLWLRYLQLLMPLGSVITFTGVFLFFTKTNLTEQFRKDPRDHVLTYFWNVLVLKLWTFNFVVWMIAMNLLLLFRGWQ